jgi:hypothetical protein
VLARNPGVLVLSYFCYTASFFIRIPSRGKRIFFKFKLKIAQIQWERVHIKQSRSMGMSTTLRDKIP